MAAMSQPRVHSDHRLFQHPLPISLIEVFWTLWAVLNNRLSADINPTNRFLNPGRLAGIDPPSPHRDKHDSIAGDDAMAIIVARCVLTSTDPARPPA
jgi:hypothetical protein